MTLITYKNPIQTPSTFNRMIDQLLNDSFDSASETFKAPVDIFETDKEFEIQLSVPGMSKNDFKIEVNEDNLTISGERKLVKEGSEKKFHSIETSYGNFSRSFSVPKNIDQDNIKASYENGILSLTLPKSEKSLEKKIKVQ